MIRDLFNVPNTISLIRLALIPVFVWMVVEANYGWAGVLLAVIGTTDWIDGFLARKLNQVTEIGKFLDPLADRLAVAVALIAGLMTDVIPPWFAWAVIVREGLISLGALYGWFNGVTKLDVRYLGKAATLAIYVSVAAFYVGCGFTSDLATAIAYAFGVPGLVMYYWVGAQYVGDMRAAISIRKG
ncbi:MAG: CDP-alcohol phosphatidyltransferase family protein [Actinomycetota bacterium]|nr:CDP-alcohol phosphatidyltransferase family protein [Actinomycetota bacterium]